MSGNSKYRQLHPQLRPPPPGGGGVGGRLPGSYRAMVPRFLEYVLEDTGEGSFHQDRSTAGHLPRWGFSRAVGTGPVLSPNPRPPGAPSLKARGWGEEVDVDLRPVRDFAVLDVSPTPPPQPPLSCTYVQPTPPATSMAVAVAGQVQAHAV